MTGEAKRLIDALREDAEWAHGNEWETPITLGDNLEAAADTIESMEAELETARHRLDQAKQELDILLGEVVGDCHVCKNEGSDKCADCHFNVYAWNTHEDYWQWRGPCAENGGTDENSCSL